ncbi:MAG: hypothetical protein KDJ65_10205 [Anaerolineae bacterium]|nr:hypothetical protein [Anaerolineae bacterium]
MKNLGNFTTHSGKEVTFRYIQKSDAGLLVDLFNQLTFESKRLRFHLYTEKIPKERIWKEAVALSTLDPQLQVAVVATIIEADGQEHAVAVARFARASVDDAEAEVAVVVRDDIQRNGLARKLFEILTKEACSMGITHFVGWVMAENVRLMKLIEKLEVPVESEIRYGQRKIRIPIT